MNNELPTNVSNSSCASDGLRSGRRDEEPVGQPAGHPTPNTPDSDRQPTIMGVAEHIPAAPDHITVITSRYTVSDDVHTIREESRNSPVPIAFGAKDTAFECPICSVQVVGKMRCREIEEHVEREHGKHVTYRCVKCDEYENPKSQSISSHFARCKKWRTKGILLTGDQAPGLLSSPRVAEESDPVTQITILYPNEGNPPCEICGEEFRGQHTYKRYKDHLKTVHDIDDLTYECRKCRVFRGSKIDTLRRHAKACCAGGDMSKQISSTISVRRPSGVDEHSLVQVEMSEDTALNVQSGPSNTPYSPSPVRAPISDIAEDTVTSPAILAGRSTVEVMNAAETRDKGSESVSNNMHTDNTRENVHDEDLDFVSRERHVRWLDELAANNEDRPFRYTSVQAITAIEEALNSRTAHPRFVAFLNRVRSAMLEWEDVPSQRDIDDLMTEYTMYVTNASKSSYQGPNRRLQQLGLGIVPLVGGRDLVYKTLAQAVFRNAAQADVVRKAILDRILSSKQYWSRQLMNDLTANVSLNELIKALRGGYCVAPRIVLQVAAEKYNLILRVIADVAEYDETYVPSNAKNESHGVRYLKKVGGSDYFPCYVRVCGTKATQRQCMVRRNRALYFTDTAKLAKEVLGGDRKLECEIPASNIEKHFEQVYSRPKDLLTRSDVPLNPGNDWHTGGMFEIDDAMFEYVEAAELQRAISRIGQRSSTGPDRVSVSLLRRYDPGLVVLTVVANACLCAGYMPNAWREHRSVLLPKPAKIWVNGVMQAEAARKIDNWRPITISSVMARIVHKVILARLMKAYKFRSNQSAFSDSAIGANVACIRSMLKYCNMRKQRHYAAFLDIKSAFDFLDHNELFRTLEKAGCPSYIRNYLASSYASCRTVFKTRNGQTRRLNIERGVKQGDPLSSFLFAFAIDATLAKLTPEAHGFQHEQINLSHIAYADDIVLFGNTAEKVNAAIELLVNGLRPYGLSFRASKCISFGKTYVDGCSRVVESSFANVDGESIPISSRTSPVTYLGCDPQYDRRIGYYERELQRTWKLLKSAALSPLQSVHLFNDYVIPKLTFDLAKSKISITDIGSLDVGIRSEMKRLLKLPKFLSNGFFHLPLSQGGMGYRSLLDAVLAERHNDMKAFAREYPVLAKWADCSKSTTTIQRANRPEYDDNMSFRDNRIARQKECWVGCKTQSQGFRFLTDVKPPTQLLAFRFRRGTLRQYLQQVRLRTGLLPTRTVMNRMSTGHSRNVSCRHCSAFRETPLHAINECLYVKPAMSRRHDAVQRRMIYALSRRQAGKCVIEQTPRYTTDDGIILIPDVVTYFPKARKAAILDIAVCYETNRDIFSEVRRIKLQRYEPLREVIARKYNLDIEDVICHAAIVGSRGSATRELVDTLNYYGLGSKTASNMCLTAAEQSVSVFHYFQQRSCEKVDRRARDRDREWVCSVERDNERCSEGAAVDEEDVSTTL